MSESRNIELFASNFDHELDEMLENFRRKVVEETVPPNPITPTTPKSDLVIQHNRMQVEISLEPGARSHEPGVWRKKNEVEKDQMADAVKRDMGEEGEQKEQGEEGEEWGEEEEWVEKEDEGYDNLPPPPPMTFKLTDETEIIDQFGNVLDKSILNKGYHVSIVSQYPQPFLYDPSIPVTEQCVLKQIRVTVPDSE